MSPLPPRFISIGRGVYKYNPKTTEYDWQYNCGRICEAEFEVEGFNSAGRFRGQGRRRVSKISDLWCLALLLLLTSCASIQAPTGYECDPSGACWPLEMNDPVRPFKVVYEPLKQIRTDHSEFKGSQSHAYGYIELNRNPAIIHIAQELPYRALVCGWSNDLILRHEIGHLNGLTRHNMVAKSNC